MTREAHDAAELDTGRPDGRLLRQLASTARELANEVLGPLRRISLQLGGASVELEWEDATRDIAGVARRAGAVAVAPPTPCVDEVPELTVRSPIVGTFYCAPAPGEPPFVTIGGTVEPDTVIGIVEAMKLMNRITAGQAGVVRSVLPDGSPVEFDQPLVVLDPLQDEGGEHR